MAEVSTWSHFSEFTMKEVWRAPGNVLSPLMTLFLWNVCQNTSQLMCGRTNWVWREESFRLPSCWDKSPSGGFLHLKFGHLSRDSSWHSQQGLLPSTYQVCGIAISSVWFCYIYKLGTTSGRGDELTWTSLVAAESQSAECCELHTCQEFIRVLQFIQVSKKQVIAILIFMHHVQSKIVKTI